MEKHVKRLTEYNVDSQFAGILTAIAAIIITLVIFTVWRKKRYGKNNILLAGLSDAGKTLIYARLICARLVSTHTSIKENMGHIIINGYPQKFIDIPGHERLRYRCFDKFKSSAKGLIYVIDSVTFQKDIRDVAEFLYNILSDPAIEKNVPVLILCNKQDQAMAKGSTIIKTLLEKEMNLLRTTKTSQVEALESSSMNVFLGKQGKDFEFSHLDMKIDFAESIAFNKNPETSTGIEKVNEWLKGIP